MPLESSLTRLVRLIVVLARNASAAARSKARMHAGHVVERLRHPQPARQHGHVGDETDVAHQRVALRARVAAQHRELAVEGGEAEDRLSAVVLPAPLGPMRPTMRPGSTLKITPSSATVAP